MRACDLFASLTLKRWGFCESVAGLWHPPSVMGRRFRPTVEKRLAGLPLAWDAMPACRMAPDLPAGPQQRFCQPPGGVGDGPLRRELRIITQHPTGFLGSERLPLPRLSGR